MKKILLLIIPLLLVVFGCEDDEPDTGACIWEMTIYFGTGNFGYSCNGNYRITEECFNDESQNSCQAGYINFSPSEGCTGAYTKIEPSSHLNITCEELGYEEGVEYLIDP